MSEPGARPHRKRSFAMTGFFVCAGLAFVVAAFVPRFFALLDEQFGLLRLAVAVLGIACIYLAGVAYDVARLRERLLDLLAATMKQLRAPGGGRDQEAVDILIRTMRSDNVDARATARGHLVRLTGEDHGDDAAKWAEWWQAKRAADRAPSTGERR